MWILHNIPNVRKKAEQGKILFGNINTFLLWRLTNGRLHITDLTNASKTMLCNIYSHSWDDELLHKLDIPRQMLPTIVSSDQVYGETDSKFFGKSITLAGMAGDQQAALFGQLCTKKGMTKNSYGTGG